MSNLVRDVRVALRALRKSPAFSIVVILTLALGLGPNTAIFSVIYGVLLRPLPYHQPERLVRPMWQWESAADFSDALTATEYAFLKTHNRVFDGMAAYARPRAGFNIVAGDVPSYVKGEFVSADLFPLLGVPPAYGRGFLPEEERAGGPPVVIVSNGFWRGRLGGS